MGILYTESLKEITLYISHTTICQVFCYTPLSNIWVACKFATVSKWAYYVLGQNSKLLFSKEVRMLR